MLDKVRFITHTGKRECTVENLMGALQTQCDASPNAHRCNAHASKRTHNVVVLLSTRARSKRCMVRVMIVLQVITKDFEDGATEIESEACPSSSHNFVLVGNDTIILRRTEVESLVEFTVEL